MLVPQGERKSDEMDDDKIHVYPAETTLSIREQPPPLRDSDVLSCVIGEAQDPTPVYLHNRAQRVILRHAYETPEREVGGVLVGGVYTWRYRDNEASTTYVEVVDAVRGESTRGSSGSLTFTPDTWSRVVAKVERGFPGHAIVGWYHTHPGHGVFLSEDDKFIQNNFFHHSSQLALVVDHIRARAAFFAGSERGGKRIRQSSEFTWEDTSSRLSQPQTGRGLWSASPPVEVEGLMKDQARHRRGSTLSPTRYHRAILRPELLCRLSAVPALVALLFILIPAALLLVDRLSLLDITGVLPSVRCVLSPLSVVILCLAFSAIAFLSYGLVLWILGEY